MSEPHIAYAFVIRFNDKNQTEPMALTFIGEPRKAFREWVAKAPGAPVNLPQHITLAEGIAPMYDAVMRANTFVVFKTSAGQPEVYAFDLPDHLWRSWAWEVEAQEWGTNGSGRRPSFIQKLQTWKLWAKKVGAEF